MIHIVSILLLPAESGWQLHCYWRRPCHRLRLGCRRQLRDLDPFHAHHRLKHPGSARRIGVFQPCRQLAGHNLPALVVRFRHLHSIDTSGRANVGIRRTTSQYMILVDFLNMTFAHVPDVNRDANVKFNPLPKAIFQPAALFALGRGGQSVADPVDLRLAVDRDLK